MSGGVAGFNAPAVLRQSTTTLEYSLTRLFACATRFLEVGINCNRALGRASMLPLSLLPDAIDFSAIRMKDIF